MNRTRQASLSLRAWLGRVLITLALAVLLPAIERLLKLPCTWRTWQPLCREDQGTALPYSDYPWVVLLALGAYFFLVEPCWAAGRPAAGEHQASSAFCRQSTCGRIARRYAIRWNALRPLRDPSPWLVLPLALFFHRLGTDCCSLPPAFRRELPLCPWFALAVFVIFFTVPGLLLRGCRWLCRRADTSPGTAQPTATHSLADLKSYEELKNWWGHDAPAGPSDPDYFGHSGLASRLGEEVRKWRCDSQSYGGTWALLGPRGSGKTGVIRRLRHELASEQGLVCFSLSLWPYDSVQAAVRGLLRGISKALGEEIHTWHLAELPARYLRAIHAMHPLLGALAGWLRLEDGPEATLRQLETTCQRTALHLLIIVEDIDRFTQREPGASRDFGPLAALLWQLDALAPVGLVLATSARQDLHTVDGEKLLRRVHAMPKLKDTEVGQVLARARQYQRHGPGREDDAWVQWRVDGTYIDGGISDLTVDLDRVENGTYPRFSQAAGSPGPLQALARVLRTPRQLKACLRELDALHVERLEGELDYDELLLLQALRQGADTVYAVLDDEHEALRRRPLTQQSPKDDASAPMESSASAAAPASPVEASAAASRLAQCVDALDEALRDPASHLLTCLLGMRWRWVGSADVGNFVDVSAITERDEKFDTLARWRRRDQSPFVHKHRDNWELLRRPETLREDRTQRDQPLLRALRALRKLPASTSARDLLGHHAEPLAEVRQRLEGQRPEAVVAYAPSFEMVHQAGKVTGPPRVWAALWRHLALERDEDAVLQALQRNDPGVDLARQGLCQSSDSSAERLLPIWPAAGALARALSEAIAELERKPSGGSGIFASSPPTQQGLIEVTELPSVAKDLIEDGRLLLAAKLLRELYMEVVRVPLLRRQPSHPELHCYDPAFGPRWGLVKQVGEKAIDTLARMHHARDGAWWARALCLYGRPYLHLFLLEQQEPAPNDNSDADYVQEILDRAQKAAAKLLSPELLRLARQAQGAHPRRRWASELCCLLTYRVWRDAKVRSASDFEPNPQRISEALERCLPDRHDRRGLLEFLEEVDRGFWSLPERRSRPGDRQGSYNHRLAKAVIETLRRT